MRQMEGSRARLVVCCVVEGGVAQADGRKWDQMEGEVDTDPPGKETGWAVSLEGEEGLDEMDQKP